MINMPLPMIGLPCKRCVVNAICNRQCGLYRKRVRLNVKIVDTICNGLVIAAVAIVFFTAWGSFK